MPQIELTKQEKRDIAEQEELINALGVQLERLQIKRAQAIKAMNYVFTSAQQRCKIEDSLDAGVEVPELVNPATLVSRTKIRGLIASWEKIETKKPDTTP